eukprot:scaffold16504_cov72-Phaeocystis_antarctica.AAC.4
MFEAINNVRRSNFNSNVIGQTCLTKIVILYFLQFSSVDSSLSTLHVKYILPHHTTRAAKNTARHKHQRRSYMASARLRHRAARLAFWAFSIGA